MGIISGIIELVKFIIDLTKNKSRITHINIPYKRVKSDDFTLFMHLNKTLNPIYKN